MLTVRLSPEIENRLNLLSQKTHRSKSFYVQKAISEFLEEQEEYIMAAAALEDFKKNKRTPISLEEMKRRLEIEG